MIRLAWDTRETFSTYRGGMAHDNPSSGEMMRRVGFGTGLSIGMGVGVALGVALDNMALGIGFGIALGTVVMIAFAVAASRLAQGGREQESEAAPADEPDDRSAG